MGFAWPRGAVQHTRLLFTPHKAGQPSGVHSGSLHIHDPSAPQAITREACTKTTQAHPRRPAPAQRAAHGRSGGAAAARVAGRVTAATRRAPEPPRRQRPRAAAGSGPGEADGGSWWPGPRCPAPRRAAAPPGPCGVAHGAGRAGGTFTREVRRGARRRDGGSGEAASGLRGLLRGRAQRGRGRR
jgi:hypothetical protein